LEDVKYFYGKKILRAITYKCVSLKVAYQLMLVSGTIFIRWINKKWERLALGALKVAYGKRSLLASGPSLKKVKAKGHKLELTFADSSVGFAYYCNFQGLTKTLLDTGKSFAWFCIHFHPPRLRRLASLSPTFKFSIKDHHRYSELRDITRSASTSAVL
jgi:hypothetical protein